MKLGQISNVEVLLEGPIVIVRIPGAAHHIQRHLVAALPDHQHITATVTWGMIKRLVETPERPKHRSPDESGVYLTRTRGAGKAPAS